MSRSYTVYSVHHVRCTFVQRASCTVMFSECTCQGCQVTQCCILELSELLKANDYEACMSMMLVFWKTMKVPFRFISYVDLFRKITFQSNRPRKIDYMLIVRIF